MLIQSIDTFFAVEHTGPESKPFMNAMREVRVKLYYFGHWSDFKTTLIVHAQASP